MLSDLSLHLSRQGHTVTVIASTSRYVKLEVPQRENTAQVKIRWLAEIGHGRLAGWIGFWVKVLFILPTTSWDRCVLLTDPPFLPFAARLARIFTGRRRRYYWWTMDLYPEALVAAEMISQCNPLWICLRWINELGLGAMNGIIALGTRQQQRLQTYKGWKALIESSVVIPPWDNRPLRRISLEENIVIKQFGWQGRKIALYSGNLGEGHLFREFADAARWFYENGCDDWVFAFVIRGEKRNDLEVMAKNLPNIQVLDYLSDDTTADLLWAATVHLVSMKSGWEGVIVPSKFYGALQTAAPILFVGPEDSDTATEIRRLKRGRTLSPNTPGDTVARILEELAQPSWKQEPLFDEGNPLKVVEFITR
jgi:glycosyltransferase involved in cell wall biosynthesis